MEGREKRSTSKPLPKKVKVTAGPVSKSDILLDKAISILDKKQRKPAEVEDQEDVFAKHIAYQLRAFPERDRNYVKFKIQELIFNVQFNGINFINTVQPPLTSTTFAPSPGMAGFMSPNTIPASYHASSPQDQLNLPQTGYMSQFNSN